MRRRVVLGVVALAALALLGWGVSMLASDDGGGGAYASFEQCPSSNPGTTLCLFTQTTGGEFIAGRKTVPISKTMTLQGGVHVVENKEREIVKDEFIAAKNGETLSRTSQPVPGGLAAVVDPELLPPALGKTYHELVEEGNTEVTATIELAVPASSIEIDVQNLIEARGIGLALPLKIKLSNAFLGESCSLGSNAHPIVVPLTTGRIEMTSLSPLHKPIRGKPGHAQFKDDYNLVTIKEDSLVSASFAAPRVEGCGGTSSPAVDRAVDAELGLPAKPGHSTAILDGTLKDANAPAVRASG
jgi:hypothetical protein